MQIYCIVGQNILGDIKSHVNWLHNVLHHIDGNVHFVGLFVVAHNMGDDKVFRIRDDGQVFGDDIKRSLA